MKELTAEVTVKLQVVRQTPDTSKFAEVISYHVEAKGDACVSITEIYIHRAPPILSDRRSAICLALNLMPDDTELVDCNR